jgi:hypothetical protein
MTLKDLKFATKPGLVAGLLGAMIALVTGGQASAAVVFSEPFTYADGELSASSAAVWGLHSGTGGQTIVNNALFINDNSSGDYNRSLGTIPAFSTGIIYAGFDMTVDPLDLPTNTNATAPYFAHFGEALTGTGTNFVSRVLMNPGSAADKFTMGLIRTSFMPTPGGTQVPTAWATELTAGTKYRVVMAYDLDADVSTLWINPTSQASTNITNTTGDNIPTALNYFMFRIDGTSSNSGDKTIDNLIVATTFNEAAAVAHPGDFDSDGDVDGADFVAWQTNFPLASGATLGQGDADADGDVDGADFVVWQTNFPFTPGPGASPVPEPATWLLMGLTLPALALLRRKLAA